MRLDNIIRLRVSEDEKRLIKEMSGRYRVSMSDMIRKQIFSDMERLNRVEKYDKEDVERIIQHFGMLMNEVGLLEQQMFKLGINMNQIAKQLNRKRGFDMNELNSRLNEFDELSDEIKSLSNKVWEGVFDE